MPTHLVSVVIDVTPPSELLAVARFWSVLLDDWGIRPDLPEEVNVVAPPTDGCPFELVFVEVPEPKTVKNRIHLDLASADADEQAALIDRALEAGAMEPDIGQRTTPWRVLADPAGNEFCVLEPRAEYAATGRLAAVVIDAADPAALAPFWAAATGWEIVRNTPEFASLRAPDGRGPWLELLRVEDPRVAKNRLHLDVSPYADGDRAAEVARLRELGAVPIDIGQGDVPWTVLADPQGNEFCVLDPRDPAARSWMTGPATGLPHDGGA